MIMQVPSDVSFPIIMLSLVRNGSVSEERVDVSCARVLEVSECVWLFVLLCLGRWFVGYF